MKAATTMIEQPQQEGVLGELNQPIIDINKQTIDLIDMRGSGQLTLRLSLTDVLEITDAYNTLFVRGTYDNSIELEEAVPGPIISLDNVVYQKYRMKRATLFIEQDVQVFLLDAEVH